MKHILFLSTLLVVSLAASRADEVKPDIVFIIADNLLRAALFRRCD